MLRAAGLAVLLLVTVAAPATPGHAETCTFQGLDAATWSPREEAKTTRCVLDRWSVPGGIPKFTDVISCESDWNRLARNGDYRGLAQHAATYWPSRVRSYMPDAWKVGPWQRWTNSRSQIVVTARMAHGSGWSAWPGCG